MIRKLIVTVVAALAITGCQNELALFPHAAGAPSPAPDPAPISHELRALWFPWTCAVVSSTFDVSATTPPITITR